MRRGREPLAKPDDWGSRGFHGGSRGFLGFLALLGVGPHAIFILFKCNYLLEHKKMLITMSRSGNQNNNNSNSNSSTTHITHTYRQKNPLKLCRKYNQKNKRCEQKKKENIKGKSPAQKKRRSNKKHHTFRWPESKAYGERGEKRIWGKGNAPTTSAKSKTAEEGDAGYRILDTGQWTLHPKTQPNMEGGQQAWPFCAHLPRTLGNCNCNCKCGCNCGCNCS